MTGDKPNVRTISVLRDDNGNVIIEVVDSGPHLEDSWGTNDYEFWYLVPVDRIPALARRLNTAPDQIVDEICTNWRGDQFYALEEILIEPGIEAELTS